MAAETAVIVLAAGKGTRTRLPLAKVLLPLCGQPMLEYVLDAAFAIGARRSVVVLHHQMDQVVERLGPRFAEQQCLVVDQGEPRGTGHAVQRALEELDRSLGRPFEGRILVLYGDCPLISPLSLEPLLAALGVDGVEAALLSCDTIEPEGLGRILRDGDGAFTGIREERDCDDDELAIEEVNTGFCAFEAATLRELLPRLGTDNAQGELYLTDGFGLLAAEDRGVDVVVTPIAEEILGINTLVQLSEARRLIQEGILIELLEKGVYIEDPASTVIEQGVEIGRGTRILPFTVIRRGARIGQGCEVGPFTHLRTGAVLEDGAEIGNFVEMKNSVLGPGSKAKHLTYLGDTTIGAKANIGAGTITANYDGKKKHRTEIGDGAFIGSGTVLVAPSKVGKGAMTGAGAVVTRGTEVPDGSVCVGVPARPLRRGAGAGDNRGEKGEE